MITWEKALIDNKTTLREAIKTIDNVGIQLALVVDSNRHLLGTVTDGDVRRGLLKGLSLSENVSTVMNTSPEIASEDDDQISILNALRRKGIHHMPIVDKMGRIVGLKNFDELLNLPKRDNWVVIMVGGLGQRLGQLTLETPKPMLQIGSKPILETIIEGFLFQGFYRFCLAVNYKADQIENYFGNGSKFGAEIKYLREQEPLGTAGALSLLPKEFTSPFFVTNGDLLSKTDLVRMLEKHINTGADATMGVRDYEMKVPFGVIEEQNNIIKTIEEKPTKKFTISAGIYILSSTVLRLLPYNSYFDMPSLFELGINAGLIAHTHRIDGYWLDIGQLQDYERAKFDFDREFE